LPAARQYGVFIPIAIAACIMVAVQQTAITVLIHRWSAPMLLVGIVAIGTMAYGLTLYVLDRRALQKGISALRHLQPVSV